MSTTLPSGRVGRAIAVGLTLLVVLVIWLGAVQPLHDLYKDRADLLAQRRTILSRMSDLAVLLPELRRRAASMGANRVSPGRGLEGETDAIAGAKLQEIVQELAGREGVTPTSMENLPAVPTGQYRRIGLRLSMIIPFPVLVKLLQAFGEATPPMLIDDLHVEGAHLMSQPVDAPLQAQLTVFGFRRTDRPSPQVGSPTNSVP